LSAGGIGRQHTVELRYLEISVADHRIVRRRALRLADVDRPLLVVLDRIDGKADHLDAAFLEFGLQRRHAAELGGADRREILGMREKHAPAVAQPFVETDRAFGSVRLEIRRIVVDRQCHPCLLEIHTAQPVAIFGGNLGRLAAGRQATPFPL
jgi:hypothetical protein